MGLLRRLLEDCGGGTLVIFAAVLPILLVLACGAVDLAAVNGDRSAMQDAADATAIAMAKQLGLSTEAGLAARAQAYAAAQLGPIAQADNVTASVAVSQTAASVTVTLHGHRTSFFGNLLPPGGWTLSTAATATAMGSLPLCVLSYGLAGGYNIHVTAQSVMTAQGCLVQSNGDITVDNGARLVAGMAQAVGTATGPITPSPQNGAPSIADPFASLTVSTPSGSCNPYNVTYISSGSNFLAPGVHCGNFVVQNGARLQLLPGEHYFTHGQLQLQGYATLAGDDVALIFDKSSHFNFQDQATVNLSGRRSGTYAGFVIATTRLNTGNFNISSTSAEKLEGVIYIPNANLVVQGVGNKVAQQSAWTVVVAQSIQLNGSADLVINANYAASSVPVPGGVGSQTSLPLSAALSQ